MLNTNTIKHASTFLITELKEEEVNYLKNKIREAIEEYEQARRGEQEAKEENAKLVTDVSP